MNVIGHDCHHLEHTHLSFKLYFFWSHPTCLTCSLCSGQGALGYDLYITAGFNKIASLKLGLFCQTWISQIEDELSQTNQITLKRISWLMKSLDRTGATQQTASAPSVLKIRASLTWVISHRIHTPIKSFNKVFQWFLWGLLHYSLSYMTEHLNFNTFWLLLYIISCNLPQYKIWCVAFL